MFTYFSQMVSTALHFFFSSAVGIAVAAVLVRGIARKQTNNHRQFLGRSDPNHALPVHSDLPGLRHAGHLAGNTHEFPAVHRGDHVGPIRRGIADAAGRFKASSKVRWLHMLRPKCWA